MQITKICLKESAVTHFCLGTSAEETQLTCFSLENQDFCSIKTDFQVEGGGELEKSARWGCERFLTRTLKHLGSWK